MVRLGGEVVLSYGTEMAAEDFVILKFKIGSGFDSFDKCPQRAVPDLCQLLQFRSKGPRQNTIRRSRTV